MQLVTYSCTEPEQTSLLPCDAGDQYVEQLHQGAMDDLAVLNASNNSFTGSLPFILCWTAPSLAVLDLSYNKFNGSVPPELGKCSMLLSLKAGHNRGRILCTN
jgi:hypothetical protein